MYASLWKPKNIRYEWMEWNEMGKYGFVLNFLKLKRRTIQDSWNLVTMAKCLGDTIVDDCHYLLKSHSNIMTGKSFEHHHSVVFTPLTIRKEILFSFYCVDFTGMNVSSTGWSYSRWLLYEKQTRNKRTSLAVEILN